MGSFWSKSRPEVGEVYEITKPVKVLGWREKAISLSELDSEKIANYCDETFEFQIETPFKVKIEDIFYNSNGLGLCATVTVIDNIPYDSCIEYQETRYGRVVENTLSTAMSRFLIPYRVKGKQELDLSCGQITLDYCFLEQGKLC